MSDAIVTPEHRQAAYAILHGDLDKNAAEAHWIETGERQSGDDADPVYVADETAQVIANFGRDVERRVRTAVIADLRGLLERSEFIGLVDYVQADSIRNLLETLEAANG